MNFETESYKGMSTKRKMPLCKEEENEIHIFMKETTKQRHNFLNNKYFHKRKKINEEIA